MANDPQVPWTDEQWARVNQVIQEEAKRARATCVSRAMTWPIRRWHCWKRAVIAAVSSRSRSGTRSAS